MQIDWFTFGAQVINFLILIALLRRFLYGPIVATMEKREQRIAAQWEETERERKQAEQEAESYRQKRQQLEDRREELMTEAKESAAQRRREMLNEVRADVEKSREGWQATVEREKAFYLRELQERAGEQILHVVQRALSDLADVELERHVVKVFTSRLRRIAPETLSASLTDSRDVVIISAFELPDDAREHLANILHEHIADDIDLRFEVNATLICGLLLQTSDYQIGWNLRDYLSLLEERLEETLTDDLSTNEESEASFRQAAQ